MKSQQEMKNEGLGTRSQYLNIDSQIAILKSINQYYKNGVLPSFNDVYESVKDIIPTGTTSDQFKNDMTALGYTYRKLPFGFLLMENPEITFERFFYLRTITEMRKTNKENIYYLDQRIVDTTLSFQKPCLQNGEALLQSTDDTRVFLYVISATGNVKGFFTNLIDLTNISKWINDVVLEVLKPKSVVVIDANLKHTTSRKEITMYDTKEDILKWLKGHSVPCTNSMRKAELYELYKKIPKKETNCNFSSLLEAYGHRVLYLPSSLYDLNPTNRLWEHIGRALKSQDPNVPPLINCEALTDLISRINVLITPTPVTYFPGFDKVIVQWEKEIFELDAQNEEALDNIIKTSMKKEQNSLLIIPENIEIK